MKIGEISNINLGDVLYSNRLTKAHLELRGAKMTCMTLARLLCRFCHAYNGSIHVVRQFILLQQSFKSAYVMIFAV